MKTCKFKGNPKSFHDRGLLRGAFLRRSMTERFIESTFRSRHIHAEEQAAQHLGDKGHDGTGDPGYSIRGEFAANGFVQNNISHTRGVISMARSRSYNSAGSQFFIMHADSPFLNAQYAAFGMLTDGFDTLDAIAATPVTTNLYGEKSVPLEDVVIASVRVETFGVDYSSFEKLQ